MENRGLQTIRNVQVLRRVPGSNSKYVAYSGEHHAILDFSKGATASIKTYLNNGLKCRLL